MKTVRGKDIAIKGQSTMDNFIQRNNIRTKAKISAQKIKPGRKIQENIRRSQGPRAGDVSFTIEQGGGSSTNDRNRTPTRRSIGTQTLNIK